MNKSENLMIVDSQGNSNNVIISKNFEVLRFFKSYKTNPHYYTEIKYDSNSNVVINYYHAGGKDSISLPHGEIYEILEAFEVFKRLNLFNSEPIRIFREEV